MRAIGPNSFPEEDNELLHTPLFKQVSPEQANELIPYLHEAVFDKGDYIFREGDKVMQIKNNYQQEWKIYGVSKTGTGRGYVLDEGVGVFNGDMGVITDISDYDEELTILFDDGRESVYNYKELDQIEHAFAVTIHKSQGSEYPAVIIPLLGGNRKLMNRNLIYTAITRARQLVIIVGDVNLVNQMVDNSEEQKRYTSLALRLEELNESME